MTLKKRVDIRCDWPHDGYSFEGCKETGWDYGINGTRLRKSVAQRGWLKVGDLDFCGVDPDQDRTVPAPNHAALLAGHDFVATQHKNDRSPVSEMLRPGCSCGWVCPADGLHLSLVSEGMVYHRSVALSVWLDIHVREDIAGIAPRYTREQFDAANARAAEREAEWKAEREAQRARLTGVVVS